MIPARPAYAITAREFGKLTKKTGLTVGDIDFATYAENQPEYLQLPVIYRKGDPHGQIISVWKLTWWERVLVLLTGKMYISQLTFNWKLQPIKPCVELCDNFDVVPDAT